VSVLKGIGGRSVRNVPMTQLVRHRVDKWRTAGSIPRGKKRRNVCVTNNQQHHSLSYAQQQASRDNSGMNLCWRVLETKCVVELHPRVSASLCWKVSLQESVSDALVTWLQINFFKNPQHNSNMPARVLPTGILVVRCLFRRESWSVSPQSSYGPVGKTPS
jgi:hypothetical protein